jgi:hypothetical protein
MKSKTHILFRTTLLVAVTVAMDAQELPPNISKENLAKDNKLFIALASNAPKWEEPTDPGRVGAMKIEFPRCAAGGHE